MDELDEQEIEKVKFLKELIISSPTNSILNADGLYGENISDLSYRLLYPNQKLENRFKNEHNLILSVENKEILVSILNIENIKVIYDFIHFEIIFENKTIVKGHDQLEIVILDSHYYLEYNVKKNNYKNIEINIVESV